MINLELGKKREIFFITKLVSTEREIKAGNITVQRNISGGIQLIHTWTRIVASFREIKRTLSQQFK